MLNNANIKYSPYISILIPTRNNDKDLIDCIRSILELEYDLKNIEIIIWDNNSKEFTKNKIKKFLESISSYPLKIKLIEYHGNLGGFNTRHELLKLISKDTQLILSIDDDVLLPKDLVEKSIPLFKKDVAIGIIGPRPVFDLFPSETAHGAGFIKLLTGQYKTEDAKSPVECDYVIGCCMLIKKEVIDDIGGFDTDYFTSHGEVDFCLRAKKKGYKVIYNPDVIVRHRVDKGGTRTPERMYYVYRNKLLVIKKNWPLPQKWFALFIYSFLWFPKAIIDSILTNRNISVPEIGSIIKAMRDGWMNRFGKRI